MKKLIAVVAVVFCISISWSYAHAISPCNPIDVKPEKKETRLGSISINPDIVAVGGLMTIMVNNGAGNKDVTIATPANTEITDYYPKENYKSAGTWTATSADGLAAGQYSIVVKVNNWTAGKWLSTSYSITSGAGTGDGYDNFFAYYDTIPMTIALDTRNMAPQSTIEVVRKVEVTAAADLQVTLATNKGKIGTTISQEIGQTVTAKADSRGIATFYLFAEEGDSIKLVATCPDTCKTSTISQNFNIGRSDVARTYTDYAWIWYTLGAVIVILLAILLIRKRHTIGQDTNKITDSSTTSQNIAPIVNNQPQMNARDKAEFFKNTNINNQPITPDNNPNSIEKSNDESSK